MLYELENGRQIKIPDAEIEKNMKVLGISKNEAIQMYLEDEGFEVNEEVEALTQKAKENHSVQHEAKSDKKRKPSTKVRKVDEQKKKILEDCRICLETLGATINFTKTETEIDFLLSGDHYTLKLTKHRPPKQKK